MTLSGPEIDIGPGQVKCLRFWFWMSDPNPGRLTLHEIFSDDEEVLLFQRQAASIHKWVESEKEILGVHESGIKFRFTVEIGMKITLSAPKMKFSKIPIPFHLGSDQGIIALDDIKLVKGPCNNGPNEVLYCTFEHQNVCGFHPMEGSNDFVWNWGSKHDNVEQNNCPSIDHTTGTTYGELSFIGNNQSYSCLAFIH